MRLSSLGTLLLGTGVAVAIGGAVAIGLGVRVDLPPAVQTLIFLKLLFIGAAGLIGAGAVVGRLARRRMRLEAGAPLRELAPAEPPVPRRATPGAMTARETAAAENASKRPARRSRIRW